ncbi:MFS transporter [Acetobacterium woodii]|uniref:Major facilitator superfamily MFS_1 transporter n=1 Tax=Acetobacterium woodii (strain ATCC 29683 / DSM 1030 / JCM 2381 / KCTC 1655 / WB1) TaxID=931626 RepID=H6LC73_ACEWD|nr:MFS transporter [Acetobacterium woodii]AFA49021.1 major facilitator superfamily MFS_1 transporter [Acetobacterium woodii DSM 1030]
MKDKNKMIMVLGLMAFLANGDNYAAAPLLINIASDLNLTISVAAMSVTAYMLAFGLFTLIFGPLSDRYGKVKIINIAAIGTAIFSMLGAFSFNLPSLLFFRAMNGAFGAGIFPVTLALVGQSFDNQSRQKAIAKVMGLMFLGGATATIIGATLAYFGSWRLVYLTYGIAELIVAIIMLKILERDQPVVDHLNFIKAYQEPLTNYRFMRLVVVIFFVGFSVFGSFTYSGKLIQEVTGYNLLIVGLILSLFGVGTVVGGRIAPALRMKLRNGFLVFAGIIGGVSLFALSAFTQVGILALALLGFGIAFIFLQSTLITAVQEKLPQRRGTAMSLASFNMFVGGAVGTSVNAVVIQNFGLSRIYLNSAFILFFISMIAAVFIARFEMRKKQGLL